MSPTKGTTVRPLRVEQKLWDQFGAIAESNGTDRSTLLRDYIKWLCGDPEAPPPSRLPRPEMRQ